MEHPLTVSRACYQGQELVCPQRSVQAEVIDLNIAATMCESRWLGAKLPVAQPDDGTTFSNPVLWVGLRDLASSFQRRLDGQIN